MPKTRNDVIEEVQKVGLGSQTHANLKGWDLRDVDLSGLNLDHVDLSEANLSGADLSCAYLGTANLYGANLEGANLSGAYLKAANLSCTNLKNTNLSNSYLYGANLQFSNLESTDLSNTDLRATDFRNIETFDGTTFKGSCAIGGWFGDGDLRNTDIHLDNFDYNSSPPDLQQAMESFNDDPQFIRRNQHPRFKNLNLLPESFTDLTKANTPKNRLLEKLANFQEIDRDTTFPIPDFIH
ncbi:pentapeptide repeat-containing protein, partial [Piscirickettsia salmonis]|uniref:pentapeptide repeat-containing protein n=1 Tax=Piscirickettsia salmonis TaxID=1238 RepID=UPI003EBBD12B